MKTYAGIITSALIVQSTIYSVTAMKKYLDELPNGSSFDQELGHPGKDSTQFTAFAKAFETANFTWDKAFCNAKFPGSSMTNGAAFGDPCCKWKKGDKPDFSVTAFTETPTDETVCPKEGGSGGGNTATKPVDPSVDPPLPTPTTDSGDPVLTKTPDETQTEEPDSYGTPEGAEEEPSVPAPEGTDPATGSTDVDPYAPATGSTDVDPMLTKTGTGNENTDEPDEPSTPEGTGGETEGGMTKGNDTPESITPEAPPAGGDNADTETESPEPESTGAGGSGAPPPSSSGCAAKRARKFRH